MSMATIVPTAVVPSGAHLQVPGAAAVPHHHHPASSAPVAMASPPAGSGANSVVAAAAAAAAAGGPPPVRPNFNSRLTSDRLREGAGLYLPPQFQPSSTTNIRKGRVSVFRETGLFDDQDDGRGSSSP
ncbi:hypothetical protein VFPFJ_03489 [Purpureocillium lilacinum]|uniref:Uncharacterized protein n=1 Tax=Purpureocillium lilacinum TaxID=33203 RepID=A0A179GWM8_PURLI|nr:hypothetical protein VFPFJ_03489 [Purpureocillium lilacinum]KAK4086267.1 hypothetical protein Purlil1_9352 [Purpureocillium lilacinum]OAQ81703.1 hypothetical protein VFPBJ_04287 [Purpureocillium lilacinum]OAQ91749.1 hypothetical protein VFPFJ_03489 [Purpureocillium lilacinum]PWI64578.1 hypothetical protein PCL_09550 [Purpureocillium lilacinum]GJN73082.1 hypothetical protein PLICBS_007158 [Purpureocillium lilacinum]